LEKNAWEKIPAAPEYTYAATIPLKVGVILLQADTISTIYPKSQDSMGNTKYGRISSYPGPEAIKGLKKKCSFSIH